MEDHASVTADMLELLHLNQTALRAGLEELSLWIKQRGSTNVHGNMLSSCTPSRHQSRSHRLRHRISEVRVGVLICHLGLLVLSLARTNVCPIDNL